MSAVRAGLCWWGNLRLCKRIPWCYPWIGEVSGGRCYKAATHGRSCECHEAREAGIPEISECAVYMRTIIYDNIMLTCGWHERGTSAGWWDDEAGHGLFIFSRTQSRQSWHEGCIVTRFIWLMLMRHLSLIGSTFTVYMLACGGCAFAGHQVSIKMFACSHLHQISGAYMPCWKIRRSPSVMFHHDIASSLLWLRLDLSCFVI
jgi:hypothetical protein